MANEKLLALAQLVGDDWTYSEYYDRPEKTMDLQWELLVWPFIQDCDFSSVLELAAGHGRNTRPLLEHTKKLYAVDMNGVNIDFIRRRFKDNDRITYIVNNGIDLAGILDEEVTFIYSFDSMVHFDGDVVRACLREFQRILVPGGHGFCHYSNYSANPTGSYKEHPCWRNFMTRELFEHYAYKEGLVTIKSELLDWLADGSYCDAVTLFRKPPRRRPARVDQTPRRSVNHRPVGRGVHDTLRVTCSALRVSIAPRQPPRGF